MPCDGTAKEANKSYVVNDQSCCQDLYCFFFHLATSSLSNDANHVILVSSSACNLGFISNSEMSFTDLVISCRINSN